MKSDIHKETYTAERRIFIRNTFRFTAAFSLLIGPLAAFAQHAWAKAKKVILPKGTKLSSLINRNPALLDTRHLEVIPVEDFRTMGTTDHRVNLDQWRLEIAGEVLKPLKLTYAQLLKLPSIERNVLLICPGIFTNHGRWKGISINELQKMAKAKPGVTHVSFRGPAGRYAKKERFQIEEIASDKIFLAYQVNGKVLPTKHGFPLRVVAEDHYGDEWIKYVHKIEFHKK
jgi:sulfoxide reductase catalytic subunit YedY